MSMPVFPDPDTILSRDEAINAILTSIAMEEAALSHIINAEGEKIQYAIARLEESGIDSDVQLLLDINKSVDAMISRITDIQIILKNKQQSAFDSLRFNIPEEPTDPLDPTDPTDPSEFMFRRRPQ